MIADGLAKLYHAAMSGMTSMSCPIRRSRSIVAESMRASTWVVAPLASALGAVIASCGPIPKSSMWTATFVLALLTLRPPGEPMLA